MKKFLFNLCVMLFFITSLTVRAEEVKTLKGIAVVSVESLNVRSGPSKDYDKIGILSKDMQVEVKGIVEPDWYVIEYQGTDGYISSQYVAFTPQDEIEGGMEFVAKKYIVMALVVAIFLVIGISIYTFIGIKKEKESIPVTDHDDTNMHMGEISYDTYRIDIDPRYFEQTTVIPQPESIYDENGKDSWKTEFVEEEGTFTSEKNMDDLDSKLEQASAQIAALQKEVEKLKKQKSDS